MRRIRLTVAYDGTDYHGWQVQPNGITVEEVLNTKLSDLLGEQVTVIGASRTDSGVHAMGNIAIFDTKTRMPAEKIAYAINQRLPEDIVVQQSEQVPPDWHPRYHECKKTYEYRILNRAFRDPNIRRNTYFYHRPLDIDAMQKAARFLVGENDFKSFCSIDAQVKTTVRTIYALDVDASADGKITIRITGNGFLYNMVRIIAGTLIQIGSGAKNPDEMRRILEARDRECAGPTAPAMGLTLMKIQYVDEE